MNSKLKQAANYSEARYLKALDDEERRQAMISRFVDELLGGHPVTARINLIRVTLTYSDVEQQMNDMLESGVIDALPANTNLICYHFGDDSNDVSLLDHWKANVSLAAWELIAKHYDSIIEESAIDKAA